MPLHRFLLTRLWTLCKLLISRKLFLRKTVWLKSGGAYIQNRSLTFQTFSRLAASAGTRARSRRTVKPKPLLLETATDGTSWSWKLL